MSQTDELRTLLIDGEPHRTDEICEKVYGGSHLGLARVSARILDLKKRGYVIKGWKDAGKPTLYWYQIKSSIQSAYKPETLLKMEKERREQAMF